MYKQLPIARLKDHSRAVALWLQVGVLAFAALVPVTLSGNAAADDLTDRSLTMSASLPDETGVTYTFDFNILSDTAIQSIMFEFCDTALAACSLPTGMDVDHTSLSIDGQTFDQATAFAEVTADSGDCVLTAIDYRYCINRTEGLDELAANPKQVEVGGVTNPTLAGNYTNVFVRIYVYSDDSFSTLEHNGTVVGVVNNTLVVNGRVQERLEFCIGAALSSDGMPDACTDGIFSNTTVDLGVIDDVAVAVAPVTADPLTGANNRYGVAFLNTNAFNGAIVQFLPLDDTSGTEKLDHFRVAGATCTAGASELDQCFEPADPTGAIAAGTEAFGMAIGCIDQTVGVTTNLDFIANPDPGEDYDGDGTADCTGYGANNFSSITKFAWNTTGNPITIVESPSVVHKEIVRLTFAATAAPTTPTGLYTVTSMFIATATF